METYVDDFFRELHQRHLKAAGYRKIRHNFHRPAEGYIERLQFQASQWNSADMPWRFYTNVGVQILDLPPRKPDRDFPQTHAWCRLESLVPSAPVYFELRAGMTASLASQLAEHIAEARAAIPELLGPVREAAAVGRFTRLCAI